MEEVKSPKNIGDIEIDLEQHDVLLIARNQRPILMIDGNIIGGLSAFKIHHTIEKTTATVRLNEWIYENPIPFNDFPTLQKLYEVGRPRLSVREAILERTLNVQSD